MALPLRWSIELVINAFGYQEETQCEVTSLMSSLEMPNSKTIGRLQL